MLIPFQSIEQLTDISRTDPLSLEIQVIDLWGVELEGSPRCLERCGEWLDDEERQRAARLVREEDRCRFVLAHGGLRAVLSRYLGIDPGEIALHRSAEGKPFLTQEGEGQPPITFNMSHSHGRALIAVSRGRAVGADLERVRSDVEVAKLSERYFAPFEHAEIMAASQEQRPAKFFRYWVSKEAVLKAQGIGLPALSQCVVHLDAEGIGAEMAVQAGSSLQGSWPIRFLSCGEGWEAAVAAEGRDWVLECGSVR